MTVDKLLPYYIAYRKKHFGEQLSELDARNQIVEFVGSETFVEFSTKPRIILCSEGFSQEITTTILWLRSWQIDISCVKITPYKMGEQIIVVPKIVLPLKTTLKAEINGEAWATLHSDTSRPFLKPQSGRIAVKVINHLGDEVMKVFRVQ